MSTAVEADTGTYGRIRLSGNGPVVERERFGALERDFRCGSSGEVRVGPQSSP